MKTRTNNSYSSLEDIIKALSKHEHTGGVWVGENYSKADLLEDLKRLRDTKEEEIEANLTLTQLREKWAREG